MTTITLVADQLREAIDAIDQDVEQALADRARLAAALAVLEGGTPTVAPAPPAPPAAPKQPKARKAPTGRPGRKPTLDYNAIAEWINRTRRDGSYSLAALADHFGTTVGTAKNWPLRCAQRGLLDPIDAKATNEPITKMPVNEEAARAAAAAQYPDSDPRKTATGYQPPTLRPATPAATVPFSIDDARAALDAAS